MLINDGVYRMRFRDGMNATDTANMIPGQHYFVDIDFRNTSYTFLAGHSLRIDVTSSNYPRYNRNMNTGQTMYPLPLSSAGDTLVNPVIANNTIYTNSAYASRVTIPCNAWPTSIVENTQPTFEAYPNPATTYIDVVNASSESCTYSIINSLGQVVKTQQSNSSTTRISLDGIGAGVYLLQMKSGHSVSTKEIIVK